MIQGLTAEFGPIVETAVFSLPDKATLCRLSAPKRTDTAECHRRAVLRVVCVIRTELDQSFSLRKMAAFAFMSPYHFDRVFRQITGLPPRQFLAAVRAEAAVRLLLTTQSSVTDICLDVGYSSLGTFIRRFTALFGVPPSRLRKMSLERPPLSARLKHPAASSFCAARVTGKITAPSQFAGRIFIGLFHGPLPKGKPVAWGVANAAGIFEFFCKEFGSFFLFAMALASGNAIKDYLLCSTALRSSSVLVDINSPDVTCPELQLREPCPTDPPILLNFGMLFASRERPNCSNRPVRTVQDVRTACKCGTQPDQSLASPKLVERVGFSR